MSESPASGRGAAPVDPSTTTDTPASADLQQERDDLQDRLLRTAAEFDNYRKRTDRERRELSQAITGDVVRDILPAIDDLERALAATKSTAHGRDQVEALRRGVELVHRQLLEVLRKRGVEPFEVIGHDFDPEWHEAVAVEVRTDLKEGTIVRVHQQGYVLGESVMRPARVTVSVLRKPAQLSSSPAT